MSRQWIRLASGFAPWAAAWGLSLAPGLPAGAQAPLPEGSEFQVNSHTPYGQTYPSVAMQPDGDFVVVWESYTSSGTDTSADQHPGPALRFEWIHPGRAVPGQHLHHGLPAHTRRGGGR